VVCQLVCQSLTVEPIDMSFGMWTRVGARNNNNNNNNNNNTKIYNAYM